MKISQYIPSSYSARMFYAVALVAIATAVSCSSGPSQEQLARLDKERQQQSIKESTSKIINSEQQALAHPAFVLYKNSCAACHGQYGAGIGKGTDADAGKPVEMRETMRPYNFYSIEGTGDITTFSDGDIVMVMRNGNHLMPSFLGKLRPNDMESIADLVTGPFRKRQEAVMKQNGERHGPVIRRKMNEKELEHAIAYSMQRLGSHQYRRTFEQTCGNSVCHGPDGKGVKTERKLRNYNTGNEDVVDYSPNIIGYSISSLLSLAYGGRIAHMPSFDPKADPKRRAGKPLSEQKIAGIADVLFLIGEKDRLSGLKR